MVDAFEKHQGEIFCAGPSAANHVTWRLGPSECSASQLRTLIMYDSQTRKREKGNEKRQKRKWKEKERDTERRLRRLQNLEFTVSSRTSCQPIYLDPDSKHGTGCSSSVRAGIKSNPELASPCLLHAQTVKNLLCPSSYKTLHDKNNDEAWFAQNIPRLEPSATTLEWAEWAWVGLISDPQGA